MIIHNIIYSTLIEKYLNITFKWTRFHLERGMKAMSIYDTITKHNLFK